MELTAARLFRRSLAEHWPIYLSGCLTMLVTSTTEVLVPKFIQWTLDFLAKKGDQSVLPSLFHADTPKGSLDLLVGVLFCILTLAFFGRVGWRQTFGRRTHDAGLELKNRIWQALHPQPLAFFHRYPLGDLMNRAIGDWNKVRFIHGFTFVLTFDVIYFTILAVIAMFLIDPELTLWCLVVVPFLPRPLYRLTKREGEQHGVAQERLSSLSDLISQAISTIRLQRATSSDAVWQRRLRDEAHDYAQKSNEVLKTSWRIFPLGALPTLGAYITLLTFGVLKVSRGEISIGEFIALQSYVLLLQGPLFELSAVFTEWQTGFVSYRRIVELLKEGKRAESAEKEKARDVVEATNAPSAETVGLTFAFADHPEKKVLKDVSLSIPRGAHVGLAGPIGSGKSTLLKILAGLLDGAEGDVRIAGHLVSHVDRRWLTSQVVMVPQKAFLFSGSIAYNLCLNQDISEARLWEVLEVVQLAADVRALPNGLNTWIGEWGINLSGGQKQRMALARALLRLAPLLLLDDCLSAVDAITEERILENLKSHFSEQSIVWVAHRLSTLKLCDRVYRLEQGTLHELA